MAGISGYVFMAVGAAVSLFSRYIQKKGGEGLQLFFWAGIIMIGIGVFKIVVAFIMKEKKSEEKKENSEGRFFGLNKDLEDVAAEKLMKEKNAAAANIQMNSIIVCRTCGTKHYSNSNFCHICGTKLK